MKQNNVMSGKKTIEFNHLSRYLNSKITLLFIVLFCLSQSLLAQTNYNVTPDGTGNSSLEGAKASIRTQTAGMSSNIVVTLGEGTYFLTEPLAFDESDGGTGDFKVIYRAASGAKPVISGGKVVTGWEQDPDNNNLYRVQISDIPHIRNLYINNKRAKRARGSVKTAAKVFYEDGKSTGLVFKKSDIDKYANTGVEINYCQHWRDFYFAVDTIEDGENIEGVNSDKYVVKIKNFDWIYKNNRLSLVPGGDGGAMNKFYFENTVNVLDEAGEWCYDNVSKYLYYYPFENEDMGAVEAIVPNIEKLIDIKSTDLSKKVKNITFKGIEFAHNSWTWPSVNGFFPAQSSAILTETSNFKLPGAIQLDGAENITFKSNFFQHIGTSAIDVYNNTKNIYITSNSFIDISATGVSVARPGHAVINASKGQGIVENTYVSNNYIERAGAEFGSCPAIEAIYTKNAEISHNEIYDVGYSGISMGFGWTANTTTLENNIIKDNKITGVNQKANDGGSIYNLSKHAGDGLLIEGNYIDELSLPATVNNEGAIYADEGSSNLHIKNNVVKSSRKWFYYNIAVTVHVDSMYVSSSKTNLGGNSNNATQINLTEEHVWRIPHSEADKIIANAGIEEGMEPPVFTKHPVVLTENNVALNKPAYSSSDLESAYSSEKGNDGDKDSFWLSGVKDQPWWYVNLQDKYIIERLDLVTRQTGISNIKTRRNFIIEACNDTEFSPENTIVLHTQGEEAVADRATVVLDNPTSDPYQYIRVRKTIDGEHMLVADLRVFGEKYTEVDTRNNVALNKPVYSSSDFESAYSSEKGNDNDSDSFWLSGVKDQPWWYVNLEDKYTIESIELVTRQTGTSNVKTRRNFVIEACNDTEFLPENTIVLHTQGEEAVADRATLVLENPTSTAYQYIRVRKTVDEEHMLVAELKVFGEKYTEEDTRDNVALGKTSYSSSDFEAAYSADKGNDNDNNSFWLAGEKDQAWWYVNLEDTYTIESIEFVTRQTGISYDATRRNFVIEACNDTEFLPENTIVLHTQGAEAIADRSILVLDNPTSIAYQYIRVRKTVDDERMLVAELKVFGEKYTEVDTRDNIALDKPSYSSSDFEAAYSADKGNDNSGDSFWLAGDTDQAWWYVNLEDTYTIESIELVTRQTGVSNEKTRRNFVIEACNDTDFLPENTIVLYTQGEEAVADRATLVLDNPTSDPYQYIRVRKTVADERMLVAELRVFGEQTDLNVLAVNDLDVFSSSVSIFPNPAVDVLHIKFGAEGLADIDSNIELSIYNMSGMLVLKKALQNMQLRSVESLNVSNLNKGLYMLVLRTKSGISRHKFMKF